MGNVGFKYPSKTEVCFVFKKLDQLPNPVIRYWLSVPEFEAEVLRAIDLGLVVDYVWAFNAMKKIYKQKEQEKNSGMDVDFKFNPARKGLRIISEILYGDREQWNK